MNIHNSFNIDKSSRAVALGYFDAVHMGHKKVITAMVNYAKQHSLESAVFTFDLPAVTAIKGKDILQADEKQQRIANIGVECFICPPFEAMQSLSPQEFVENILHHQLCAKAVFCGNNYTFGAKKAGDTALLTQLCKAFNIKVYIIDMAELCGEDISASRIRQYLDNGDVNIIATMMGMPYSITLPVLHGKALGRTIGVPTINQIYPPNMHMPKSGVYATRVLINGTYYAGATGIGSQPTVGGAGVTCETYIKAFSGDLYDQSLRLEFLQYLFPTKKYDNLDQLRQAILLAAEKSSEIPFG